MNNHMPACTNCKRTHTNVGNPVKLKVKGEYKGLCKACMRRLVWSQSNHVPQEAVDRARRSLDYFTARRHERLVSRQRPATPPRNVQRRVDA